ncbi:MAG: hypothetical protein EOP49_14990, partial [Sphingobacteriales bacterium]
TGLNEGGISPSGLTALRDRLIAAGTVEAAGLSDIKADRLAVLPGGLAIMRAIFQELDVETMQSADGALRVGVLYDLLGRDAEQDKRQDTVRQFMTRYECDAVQAARVRRVALDLYAGIAPQSDKQDSITTLKSTYKRVVMKMDMPGMNVDIDTDKPATDSVVDIKTNPMGMMGSMFRAIVGKSFVMKVNPEGQVTMTCPFIFITINKLNVFKSPFEFIIISN